MHPNGFRLLVLVSLLVTALNAATGFTFDDIQVNPLGDDGFYVTRTAMGLGAIVLLHGFLFFFWNPSRFVLGFLLAVLVAVAFLGIWPLAEQLNQLNIGMTVLTAVMGGALTATAFSGDIAERFARK